VTRWPAAGGGGANWSPGLLDRAETFAESDVSVSHSDTQNSGEAIELSSVPSGNVTSRPDDDSSSSSGFAGVVINPNRDLEGVVITESGNTDGNAAELYDSSGTLLASNSSYTGSTARIEYQLSSGTDYHVGFDAGSRGYYSAGSTPYTGEDADITAGLSSPTGTQTEPWGVLSVEGLIPASSGSSTIEWPMPADLAGWDIIPYEATEDGGTVEVYAVDPSDGTRLAGPLDDPGDISSLSPSTNVAVEVVLERPSTSENPRLEAVYRRRKIT